MIGSERLKALLSFDAETGCFRWRESRQGVRPDLCAGRVGSRGYVQICIDYRKYAAHRLAWLYVHGEWPISEIDHVNGNRADNRLANLRPATRGQNSRNRKRAATNSSGFKGIYKATTNRWRAQIKVNDQQIVLGHFEKQEDAHAAYVESAKRYFGEFASSGEGQ